MVDQNCFFLPPINSGNRNNNSSCINTMERGGSWKPSVDVSPACPRCGSSNTKFCYYNNYSLTQPRYFCKGCRRYWTKGGSLRNVPVGGGCRKSRRTNIKPPSRSPIGVPSTALSTGVVNGKVVVTSPFGLISMTPHRHSPNSTSPTQGTPSSDGPTIDLALVYANFLNPNNKTQPPPETTYYHHQQQQQHEQHQQYDEIIPQLPNENSNIIGNCPGPSFKFLGVQNNLHLDLTAPPQQDGSLSHGDNYVVYHSGGLDSIHHHHLFTNVSAINNYSSNITNGKNYVLPPMPDDEELLVVSQDMTWPSSLSTTSVLMHPSRQILEVNQSSPPPSSVVQQQEQNCQRPLNENDDNDMSSLISIPTFEDIFKT